MLHDELLQIAFAPAHSPGLQQTPRRRRRRRIGRGPMVVARLPVFGRRWQRRSGNPGQRSRTRKQLVVQLVSFGAVQFQITIARFELAVTINTK